MKALRLLLSLTAVFFLLTAGIYAAETPENAPQEPAAVADHTNYSFEAVPEGSEVRHTFSIRNQGNAPLKISRVKTG